VLFVWAVGTSSIFMGGFGHRIFFQIDKLPGYIEITKNGFTGFTYKCVINNKLVDLAITHSRTPSPNYSASIPTVTFVPLAEEKVAWYSVQVTRQSDLITTTVHRFVQVLSRHPNLYMIFEYAVVPFFSDGSKNLRIWRFRSKTSS
jgi:hypothetical protein